MNKPINNALVTRYLLLLQEFDITAIDKLGKENVIVDFLSRLTTEGDPKPIEDIFLYKPYKPLFALSTHDP